MPLEIGQKLQDRYRVDQVLGEGTFGFVYLATDLANRCPIAIKELRPDLAFDSDAFQRFKREAEAVRALQHPSIVGGLGLVTANNGFYILMEYMDGGNLAEMLEQRGALTPQQALDVTLPVLDALAVIHKEGIVHRDIKPSNILFSSDGLVKLADFGTAHIPIRGEQTLTVAGTVIGTVNHMSPEQARGERVDARSDLYAVGALMYEMLAGHPYLNFGKHMMRNIELVENARPLPLPPEVPPKLAAMVMTALAKSREARFRTAEEMRDALERLYQSWSGPEPRARRGKPSFNMLALLLGAGALVALCFLGSAVAVLFLVAK